MNTRVSRFSWGLATVLVAASLTSSAHAVDKPFSLSRAVPDDVFIFVAGRHNAEREFLNKYWGEVFDALKESGIGADVMELIGSWIGEDEMAEVNRLKELATTLLAGVEWQKLASNEMVFVERLPMATRLPGGGFAIIPEMAILFRANGDGAAKNYEGLVAILDNIVIEINRAADKQVLTVDKTPVMGAKAASVNLLASVSESQSLPVTVAQRGDMLIVTLGEGIRTDVHGLLSGTGSAKALGDSARFKAAFAMLPPAEDTMFFFDMQAMLKPIRGITDEVMRAKLGPKDLYVNATRSGKAFQLSTEAFKQCEKDDFKAGLKLLEEAHQLAPADSRIMYNLACVHARLGHKNKALNGLQKAVDAGFYAPQFMPTDPDFDGLRNDRRYKVALAKATEMAEFHGARDNIVNATRSGEAWELCQKAYKLAAKKEYKESVELGQQAYKLAPDDAWVLYNMACFHARNGDEDIARDFLNRAVDGGFYAPRHIARDPDIESLRGGEWYKTLLAKAATNATAQKVSEGDVTPGAIQLIIKRLMDVPGILDYVAVVESTDGYTVREDTVCVLVPGAKKNAFYPVFGKQVLTTDFDRFLPKETESFAVCAGIDLDELYKFIEDSFRTVGPKGEALLAKWEAIQKQVGLDVKKDIIGWIDSDSIVATLEHSRGSVLTIKVSNDDLAKEKLGAAIDLVSKAITEGAAKQPMLAMMSVRRTPSRHKKLEGFENLFIGLSPQPIVWGVADGHVIFGTTADAVVLCLATAKGEHPSIRQNARAMGEAIVPDGPFSCVTLTDHRKLAQELTAAVGMGAMITGMMSMAIPEPDVRRVLGKVGSMLGKLTPVVGKIDFYKSTASSTTFDGMVWRTRSVTNYVSPAERAGGDETEPRP